MARVQLALNVANLDEAISFYSQLFATEPAKVHDGYANFAIADPPLKLVLFEAPEAENRLNHLGVEVADPAEVREHQARLGEAGIEAADGSGTCCFAELDKVWIDAPDGAWEFYSVLADSDTFGGTTQEDGSVCCATPAAATGAVPACC